MTEQRLQEIEAQAKEATTRLRDAVRCGEVIEFRQRDPLIVAIHRAIDELIAEVRRLTAERDEAQRLRAEVFDQVHEIQQESEGRLNRAEAAEATIATPAQEGQKS